MFIEASCSTVRRWYRQVHGKSPPRNVAIGDRPAISVAVLEVHRLSDTEASAPRGLGDRVNGFIEAIDSEVPGPAGVLSEIEVVHLVLYQMGHAPGFWRLLRAPGSPPRAGALPGEPAWDVPVVTGQSSCAGGRVAVDVAAARIAAPSRGPRADKIVFSQGSRASAEEAAEAVIAVIAVGPATASTVVATGDSGDGGFHTGCRFQKRGSHGTQLRSDQGLVTEGSRATTRTDPDLRRTSAPNVRLITWAHTGVPSLAKSPESSIVSKDSHCPPDELLRSLPRTPLVSQVLPFTTRQIVAKSPSCCHFFRL